MINRRGFLQSSIIAPFAIKEITTHGKPSDDTAGKNSTTTPVRFDIVIYGATPAGIAAAVAAAREGKSVVIIEPLPIAGGILSGGMGFSDSNQMHRETLGGIFKEYYKRIEKYYISRGEKLSYQINNTNGTTWRTEPHVNELVFNKMMEEEKVTLFLNEKIRTVQQKNNAIESITTYSGMQLSGKVFIDASYEGDLMAFAGVEYRVGRESKAEFNESVAGVRFPKKQVDITAVDSYGEPLPLISTTHMQQDGLADNHIMAYSFRLCLTKDPANRVPIAKPANYNPNQYELLRRYYKAFPDYGMPIDLYPIPGNKYDGNNGIRKQISMALVGENWAYPEANYERREVIQNKFKDFTQGLLYFLKTDPAVPKKVHDRINELGYAKDEFEAFGHFPPVFYVREARRMVGEYFLTQDDILKNRTKPDSVGIGSFPIDSHDCQRILTKDKGFINEGTIFNSLFRIDKLGYAYQVPYRSIIPRYKDCTNLLVPVCLSASHVALASIRVEPTWMVLGESAGIAAAVAVESNAPVQKLDYGQLATRLKKRGQILALPAHLI